MAGALYGAVTYIHPYIHTYMAGAVPEVAYGGSKQREPHPHNSSPPARPPKQNTHAPPNNDALRAEGGPGGWGGGGGGMEVSRSVYSEEEQEGEPSLTDWKIEVFRQKKKIVVYDKSSGCFFNMRGALIFRQKKKIELTAGLICFLGGGVKKYEYSCRG
jgi:hypothetical protein